MQNQPEVKFVWRKNQEDSHSRDGRQAAHKRNREEAAPSWDDDSRERAPERNNGNYSPAPERMDTWTARKHHRSGARLLGAYDIIACFSDPSRLIEKIRAMPEGEQLNKLQYALILLLQKLKGGKDIPHVVQIVTEVSREFYRVLELQSEAKQLPERTSTYIATLLDQVGQISQGNTFFLDVAIINGLLYRLIEQRELSVYNIASALSAVGCLATNRCFRGLIDMNHVNVLLDTLVNRCATFSRSTRRDIAVVLRTIGDLAQYGYLSGPVADINVNALLAVLRWHRDATTQEIGDALSSVGYLVASGKLSINSLLERRDIIAALLDQFYVQNAHAQASIEAIHQIAQFLVSISWEIPENIIDSLKAHKRTRQLEIGAALVAEYAGEISSCTMEARVLDPERRTVGLVALCIKKHNGGKIIVELERPDDRLADGQLRSADQERDRRLCDAGYEVLRFSMCVSTEKVIKEIKSLILGSLRDAKTEYNDGYLEDQQSERAPLPQMRERDDGSFASHTNDDSNHRHGQRGRGGFFDNGAHRSERATHYDAELASRGMRPGSSNGEDY